MAVRKLKNCPRCNNELFVRRERETCYESCVLCGNIRDISNLVAENTVGQIKVKYTIEDQAELSPQVIITDES